MQHENELTGVTPRPRPAPPKNTLVGVTPRPNPGTPPGTLVGVTPKAPLPRRLSPAEQAAADRAARLAKRQAESPFQPGVHVTATIDGEPVQGTVKSTTQGANTINVTITQAGHPDRGRVSQFDPAALKTTLPPVEKTAAPAPVASKPGPKTVSASKR